MASNNLTFTLELSQEALEAIRQLTAAINKSAAGSIPQTVSESHPVVDPFPAAAEPVEAPAAEPAPEPVKEPEPVKTEPVKEYSIDDVRARVMALSRKDAATKAAVKAALNKYAESVPKLPADKYAAFMADLEALA